MQLIALNRALAFTASFTAWNRKIPLVITQNTIQIENNSSMSLLIRHRGEEHNASKEFYIGLVRNTRRLLERSLNSIYKLNATTAKP